MGTAKGQADHGIRHMPLLRAHVLATHCGHSSVNPGDIHMHTDVRLATQSFVTLFNQGTLCTTFTLCLFMCLVRTRDVAKTQKACKMALNGGMRRRYTSPVKCLICLSDNAHSNSIHVLLQAALLMFISEGCANCKLVVCLGILHTLDGKVCPFIHQLARGVIHIQSCSPLDRILLVTSWERNR